VQLPGVLEISLWTGYTTAESPLSEHQPLAERKAGGSLSGYKKKKQKKTKQTKKKKKKKSQRSLSEVPESGLPTGKGVQGTWGERGKRSYGSFQTRRDFVKKGGKRICQIRQIIKKRGRAKRREIERGDNKDTTNWGSGEKGRGFAFP